MGSRTWPSMQIMATMTLFCRFRSKEKIINIIIDNSATLTGVSNRYLVVNSNRHIRHGASYYRRTQGSVGSGTVPTTIRLDIYR